MAQIIDFATHNHAKKREKMFSLVEQALQYSYESGNLGAALMIESAKANALKGDMVTFRHQMELARKALLSVHRV